MKDMVPSNTINLKTLVPAVEEVEPDFNQLPEISKT
jgi:hypothetical protein